MNSETPDIFEIKHKEHNKQLYRTNQIGKVGTTTPKTHPKKTNKNIKKHVETYEFYHRKWARTHWDSRSGRATRTMAAYLHVKTGQKTKTANNLMATWQPNFRKDNPSTKKPLSHAARDHLQEEETLLLRNSIEEEEEEEDEDLFESYITNGTHPPAPPDR